MCGQQRHEVNVRQFEQKTDFPKLIGLCEEETEATLKGLPVAQTMMISL